MKVTAETTQKLNSILDKAVEDESEGAPGLAFVAVDRAGTGYSYAAGRRGIFTEDKIGPDSIFWIASCTKLVTAICCLQLHEQGRWDLDDDDVIESLCPELRDLEVLNKDGTRETKKRKITLRMLLTHTAGFGYSFFNERLRNWGYPAGIDEFSGSIRDIKQPLLFQPGEGWEYGVNLDWAGVALERLTGRRLDEYVQEHICAPLDIKNVGFVPTEEMKKKLVHMHHRRPDGKLEHRDHLHRRALIVDSSAEKDDLLHSGGAGLFASPLEYTRILAMLLNDGKDAATGKQVLQPSTVALMFTNQIPQFPDHGRQGIPAAKSELTNPIPDMYPTATPGEPQGWGLSMQLSSGPTGRGGGTGWWTGLANLFWWVDREKGIAGMVASQVLPFLDAKVIGAWVQAEAAVYEALANGGMTVERE